MRFELIDCEHANSVSKYFNVGLLKIDIVQWMGHFKF